MPLHRSFPIKPKTLPSFHQITLIHAHKSVNRASCNSRNNDSQPVLFTFHSHWKKKENDSFIGIPRCSLEHRLSRPS